MKGRLNDWSTEDLLCVYGDHGFEEQTQELRRLYDNEVRAWIGRRIRDDAGVCDVASVFWTNVLTGKNTFIPAGPGSARAWMRGIATHATSDEVRRRVKRGARQSSEAVEQLATVGPEAEAVCSDREHRELIHRAIASLPIEYQAVLVLARFGTGENSIGQGLLTQAEVAQLLGCCEGSAVHRYLQTICKMLKRLVGVTTEEE